ncbi:MAG: tRNA isopentenyl-2-thiomethyl-A-37 hydroxylase MiaE, partial [Flammeovirgaceae bacterium]
MKYSIELACDSSQEWLDAVMADFDSFLIDHADCERKASAMAMSMVARYPDKPEIIPGLIDIGIEELEHFRDVFALMQERGINFPRNMSKDPYIQQLMPTTHGGTPETRFLSHLLLGSVVECRGCERFKMVSEALEEERLKRFYKLLWTS